MKPKKVVVVLLDSLNRHLLGCYGGSEFETPNIDRFAARSLKFTNHYTGSLPCMPARHDILVGAMVAMGHAETDVEKVIGFIAVLLGAGNAVGGYVVTERMLEMFKSTKDKD